MHAQSSTPNKKKFSYVKASSGKPGFYGNPRNEHAGKPKGTEKITFFSVPFGDNRQHQYINITFGEDVSPHRTEDER